MRLMFWVMAAIFVGSAVSAQQMTAVAVSPDGATVLAAGDNRVLYTLDGATLEVTDRKYIPQQVKEIHYSRDGRRIFLRMDNRLFRAHAAGSFKMLFEVENISSMSLESVSSIAVRPSADMATNSVSMSGYSIFFINLPLVAMMCSTPPS